MCGDDNVSFFERLLLVYYYYSLFYDLLVIFIECEK